MLATAAYLTTKAARHILQASLQDATSGDQSGMTI